MKATTKVIVVRGRIALMMTPLEARGSENRRLGPASFGHGVRCLLSGAGHHRYRREVANETTRIIPRDGVTQDDIDDAMADLGCRLVNVVPPTPSLPGQMIYATRDRKNVLYLVEDVQLGLSYFTGVGEDIVVDLDELRERLPCLRGEDLDGLLTACDGVSERVRALSIMALSVTNEPSDDYLSFFHDSLEHPSMTVRFAALVALSYVRWPPLRTSVERIAASDEDGMIRFHAQRVLELYGS